MESWKYQNLKSRVPDMINIAHRSQAQETISHGRGNGLFNMEGTGENSDSANNDELWGYGVNTYEEVNLIRHVQSGGVGFDDEWSVASEHTHLMHSSTRDKGAKTVEREGLKFH